MSNHVSTSGDDGGRGALTGEQFESRVGSSFTIGGAMILGSLVAPIALGTVISQAWAPGVGLVAGGVLAATAGLLGLYQHAGDRSPVLAKTGAAGAAVAGLAALGLIGLITIVGLTAATGGPAFAEPIELFVGLGMSIAAGLSVGFLSFGIAAWRADDPSRTVGKLLTGGGALLFAATVGELLRTFAGTGPPPWVVLPVLALVAVDALLIGRYI